MLPMFDTFLYGWGTVWGTNLGTLRAIDGWRDDAQRARNSQSAFDALENKEEELAALCH